MHAGMLIDGKHGGNLHKIVSELFSQDLLQPRASYPSAAAIISAYSRYTCMRWQVRSTRQADVRFTLPGGPRLAFAAGRTSGASAIGHQPARHQTAAAPPLDIQIIEPRGSDAPVPTLQLFLPLSPLFLLGPRQGMIAPIGSAGPSPEAYDTRNTRSIGWRGSLSEVFEEPCI